MLSCCIINDKLILFSRGNYKKAAEYFDEAIKRFTSVEELYHLFCVRNTSLAQVKAEERVGPVNPMHLFGSS